jgi:hypothetical protein
MEIQQYFADAHNNEFMPLTVIESTFKCRDNKGLFGKIGEDFARVSFRYW